MSLSKSFNRVKQSSIAKELAYCLCTDVCKRLRLEHYHLAFNTVVINDWSNIAVIKTEETIRKLSDIVCIDYSEYYNDDFRSCNSQFLKLVLFELNQLRKI